MKPSILRMMSLVLNKPLLTTKQVGRIITKAGIKKSAKKLNKAITESVKDEHPKNE